LAVPAATLAAALVAGNAVVFKPAEDTPLVGTRLVEILLEAGLPPGVVNLVHGSGEDAGAPLVRHPNVALVAFMGSGGVGREVAIACAAEGKRIVSAPAGTNALIVLEDADLGLALEGAVHGAFAVAGQRRTAVRRLILQRKIAREFTERLVARAGSLRVGEGTAPATEVGPLINETRLKRLHAYIRLGVKEGARLLCGGEVFREGDGKRGFFYLPTVLGEVRASMRVAQEEILGPALCLLAVPDVEGAIAAANAARSALSVGLYTRDLQRAFLAGQDLRARHITVNPAPAGEGADRGLRAADLAGPFTEERSITIEYAGRLGDGPEP
jgi:aldehyde dehydrogenase (NAD+)